jgi:hypothetical protein
MGAVIFRLRLAALLLERGQCRRRFGQPRLLHDKLLLVLDQVLLDLEILATSRA